MNSSNENNLFSFPYQTCKNSINEKKHTSFGNHLVVDLFDIPENIFLNEFSRENFNTFDTLVEISLTTNKMHIIKKEVHFFDSPVGALTSFYLLAESHLAIHTWPENRYISLDIYTCGECNTLKIVEEIIGILKPESYKIQQLKRGC
jgi:S-adenosylmethionine decarboxylase proenzyme